MPPRRLNVPFSRHFEGDRVGADERQDDPGQERQAEDQPEGDEADRILPAGLLLLRLAQRRNTIVPDDADRRERRRSIQASAA